MKYMRKLMQKAHQGQGGFTLIELLVVVAILGVIAAVVVLNVGGFMGKGQQDSANTEAHQVQTAIIAYMADAPTSTLTAGSVSAAAPGIAADFLVDPGKLQATYAYGTDGAIIDTGTSATSGGKWDGCTFASGSWTCT